MKNKILALSQNPGRTAAVLLLATAAMAPFNKASAQTECDALSPCPPENEINVDQAQVQAQEQAVVNAANNTFNSNHRSFGSTNAPGFGAAASGCVVVTGWGVGVNLMMTDAGGVGFSNTRAEFLKACGLHESANNLVRTEDPALQSIGIQMLAETDDTGAVARAIESTAQASWNIEGNELPDSALAFLGGRNLKKRSIPNSVVNVTTVNEAPACPQPAPRPVARAAAPAPRVAAPAPKPVDPCLPIPSR